MASPSYQQVDKPTGEEDDNTCNCAAETPLTENWFYREKVLWILCLVSVLATGSQSIVLYVFVGINSVVSIQPLYTEFNAQTTGIPSGFVEFQLASPLIYPQYLPPIALTVEMILSIFYICVMLNRWYRHNVINNGITFFRWIFVSIVFAVINLDIALMVNTMEVIPQFSVVSGTVVFFLMFIIVDEFIVMKREAHAFGLLVISIIPFATVWGIIFQGFNLTGDLAGTPNTPDWITGVMAATFALELCILIMEFVRILKSLCVEVDTKKARAGHMPVSVWENEIAVLLITNVTLAIVSWVQFGFQQPL